MDNQQVTDYEIGWMVGIIDGEGCFSLAKRSRGYSPSIKIVNTNNLIIEEASRILTALNITHFIYNATRASNQKPAKRLEINGLKRVQKFLDFFDKYFYCKMDQATYLKQFVDLRLNKDIKEPYGEEEHSLYFLLRK